MRTTEAKHALIAERLEGQCAHKWEWKPRKADPCPTCNHDRNPDPDPDIDDYPLKRCAKCGKEVAGLLYRVGGPLDVPNYSTDLNLVARVEAKVAEMGLQGEYMWALGRVLDLPPEASVDVNGIDAVAEHAFCVITAPPAARVDALCALIDSMNTATEEA